MHAQIESKIFFCDAKANSRGLYLKISEKGTNRERSTIIVPGQSLPWFRELFNYYATTEPSCAYHLQSDGLLHSHRRCDHIDWSFQCARSSLNSMPVLAAGWQLPRSSQ